jgi:hypothetical protein
MTQDLLKDFPPSLYSGNLSNRFVIERNIHGTLQRVQSRAFRFGIPFDRHAIGPSRNGLDLFGLIIGSGTRHVSITAGAHADEPVGPMTALALAEWLVEAPAARSLVKSHKFYICPNVNPDGAEANAVWFDDPVDPLKYFQHVIRELPGDDVEFGYPDPRDPATRTNLRPENLAVADFLAEGAPFVYHASLHGMSFAEGAWFLIGKDWAERSGDLQRVLIDASRDAGLPLHDIDRHGEKGFTRISEGFCTTPTSVAMKEFFHSQNDSKMAAKFHLSSMEYVQALGGDPLVMVSELSLFLIGDEATRAARGNPPGDDTLYQRFRPQVAEVRAHLLANDVEKAREILSSVSLQPVPLLAQINLQARMVIEGVAAASASAA